MIFGYTAMIFNYAEIWVILVYHCFLTNNFGYKVYYVPFNFGYIGGNVGYFGYIFSGILVYHYTPWSTLINIMFYFP